MSIYLNTASCGLIIKDTIQSVTDLYEGFLENASATANTWEIENGQRIKNHLADFLHTKAENIAYIPNFSYGINAVVQSLTGKEKILLYKNDFPSLTLPFVNNRFDIFWIDDDHNFSIEIEKIESIIEEESINIVAISHIQWMSGYKIDLPRLSKLCKSKKVKLIVDGTQSLGAANIDFSENAPDVFIASNYKWMNAGYGTGILYINDRFLQEYPPVFSGNHSKNLLIDIDPQIVKNSILLYEPGHINMHGLALMDKALEKKLQTTISEIEKHNLFLASSLLNELIQLPIKIVGPDDMTNRSSIISLYEEDGLHHFLLEKGIITTSRFGYIRISIHYYNTIEDINAIVDVLKQWKNN